MLTVTKPLSPRLVALNGTTSPVVLLENAGLPLTPSPALPHSKDGTIGTGAAFETDLVDGVFHRLAGDPDDSPERRIQLLTSIAPATASLFSPRNATAILALFLCAGGSSKRGGSARTPPPEWNRDPNRVLLGQKPSRPHDRADELYRLQLQPALVRVARIKGHQPVLQLFQSATVLGFSKLGSLVVPSGKRSWIFRSIAAQQIT
jgi:hypothetical protein